jgi:hypothetical protein
LESHSLIKELKPFGVRFAWAALYLNAVIVVGAFGFRLIERWTWFDSFPCRRPR